MQVRVSKLLVVPSLILIAAFVAAGIAVVAQATHGRTGNEMPNGPHYTLNLIGVPKEKTADMTGTNRHVIFAPLEGNTKITLSEGDFRVLDGNGTDGEAAFQLPNPDP